MAAVGDAELGSTDEDGNELASTPPTLIAVSVIGVLSRFKTDKTRRSQLPMSNMPRTDRRQSGRQSSRGGCCREDDEAHVYTLTVSTTCRWRMDAARDGWVGVEQPVDVPVAAHLAVEASLRKRLAEHRVIEEYVVARNEVRGVTLSEAAFVTKAAIPVSLLVVEKQFRTDIEAQLPCPGGSCTCSDSQCDRLCITIRHACSYAGRAPNEHVLIRSQKLKLFQHHMAQIVQPKSEHVSYVCNEERERVKSTALQSQRHARRVVYERID